MQWNGDVLISSLEIKSKDNLQRAAIYLKGKIKEKINIGQPYTRYVGKKGIYYKGLNPSLPGEPPKKVISELQRSIAHAVDANGIAIVGSNLKTALYLERGTARMAARPFLKSTLLKESAAIAKIIAGDSK